MDQGSIPCISKSAQNQTILSVVEDELGGIRRLIPLCKYSVAIPGDDFSRPSQGVDAPDARGLWSHPQLQVFGAIVVSHAVAVMNVLAWQQIAS